MKNIIVVILFASLFFAGCEAVINRPVLLPPSPPTGLRTSTGDNFIELFWNANPEGNVAGYNVFVSGSFNGRYEPIGSTRTPYFMDKGARNGNTYYYAVTAYDYDGNESPLSKDVAYDIPRPEGYNVVLDNFRQVPAYAGYDFSQYSVVPYDDQYSDMYFENYNGTLYIDVRTDTDIQDMGPTSSILDISQAPTGGWSSTHDALVYVGHTYVVRTWDNHYAKFRVSGLSQGSVVFDWAYQLQVSTPLLKTSAGSAASRPPVQTNRVK